MDIFPYGPRAQQMDIVSFIRDSVISNKHAVMESGTGTGKTVCALTGTIEAQSRIGGKIVYLTRTKSQQKQVMSELRMINERVKVFGIAVQGRSASTCPQMKDNSELADGSSEELSRLCSEYKKKTEFGCKCQYFEAIKSVDVEQHIRMMRESLPDPESFQAYCVKQGLCPYEMMKLAISYADVVCAPYSFLLMPNIRRHFLNWMNASIEDITIIVDEAHNIPDYLRDVLTSRYTLHALDYAEKEARDWKDPELNPSMSVTDLVNVVRGCFQEAISEYLIDEDGIIPQHFLEEELMSRLKVSSVTLDKIYKTTIEIGEMIIDKKKILKKLPRSYIGSLGRFLQFWTMCDESTHIKQILGGDNPSFEAYCLDPYFAADPLRNCRSSIHMSGTLKPLDEYASELGLETASLKCFDSPFNPENLLSLYVDGMTTNYDEVMMDPENIDRIKDTLVRIVKCVRKNTAVFFPSYNMMGRFIADGIPELFEREVYYEKREMSQTELMEAVDNFRTSNGSILFAVAGGRISEGLDFPDKDLELAVLIGIPYPYPSVRQKALVRYCDIMFGNGWEHVVKSPTTRKMRQSRGRLIRSETDRGVSIVLDKRVAGITGYDAVLTDDPCRDISEFFNNRAEFSRKH